VFHLGCAIVAATKIARARSALVPGGLCGCLYRNNAESAERIRAMISSGDLSDDGSIADGTECDGDYVEVSESDTDCAEDTTTTHD
jgi:hypothetical protein